MNLAPVTWGSSRASFRYKRGAERGPLLGYSSHQHPILQQNIHNTHQASSSSSNTNNHNGSLLLLLLRHQLRRLLLVVRLQLVRPLSNHGHDALTPSAFSDKIQFFPAKTSASNLRGSQSTPTGKIACPRWTKVTLPHAPRGRNRCGAEPASHANCIDGLVFLDAMYMQ
ncbi:hypothetical protein BN1708_002568 [Verticillium longisporum]|uniref:Uncharacterized protein n=1 Tax=Verticillium longisporum TaxID=100787 RepID=A0A0G4KTY6_VERLO|nr:hypothetical protein BN1708_002568 [Verticillium longisporum]